MRQDRKLIIGMSLLFLLIFVVFGVIIVNDKVSFYYIPKIDKKLNNYLNKNYKDILDEVNIGKTTYKNTIYTLKIESKENKNLYFNINYQNKNISTTYKKDYLEGNSLLRKIEKDLKKEINNKTKYNIDVKINKKLNEFPTNIKRNIIKENNLINTNIYDISTNITVNDIEENIIIKKLITLENNLTQSNIKPRLYNIKITNNDDEILIINNITNTLIKSNDLNKVINDIINKKKSNILKTYNITDKYYN